MDHGLSLSFCFGCVCLVFLFVLYFDFFVLLLLPASCIMSTPGELRGRLFSEAGRFARLPGVWPWGSWRIILI